MLYTTLWRSKKRSDVVFPMSDVIFPMSHVVFSASNVVFGMFGKEPSIKVLLYL